MEDNNLNEFYFTSQIYNERTNRKYFDPNHYRFLFYEGMKTCVKKVKNKFFFSSWACVWARWNQSQTVTILKR